MATAGVSQKLGADDALALATSVRESAKKLGDYLYGNWADLSPSDRERLRSLEVTLLNLATDLVTQAVGVILAEGEASLEQLKKVTESAKKALGKIANAKKAIVVVTALIGLAAAIPTGNLQGIASAAKAVKDALKDGAAKKKDE